MRTLILPLCIAGLAACLSPSCPPSAGPVCYELTFGDDGRPGIAPDRIELEAGRDSGRAVWLSSPRQGASHVLVGQVGRWRANEDSLVVEFVNPRMRADIELRGAGATLRGRAGGMSDGAIGIRDWRATVARRIACPASTAAAAPRVRT